MILHLCSKDIQLGTEIPTLLSLQSTLFMYIIL